MNANTAENVLRKIHEHMRSLTSAQHITDPMLKLWETTIADALAEPPDPAPVRRMTRDEMLAEDRRSVLANAAQHSSDHGASGCHDLGCPVCRGTCPKCFSPARALGATSAPGWHRCGACDHSYRWLGASVKRVEPTVEPVKTTCPGCKASHSRGPIDGRSSYRCLNCGMQYQRTMVNGGGEVWRELEGKTFDDKINQVSWMVLGMFRHQEASQLSAFANVLVDGDPTKVKALIEHTDWKYMGGIIAAAADMLYLLSDSSLAELWDATKAVLGQPRIDGTRLAGGRDAWRINVIPTIHAMVRSQNATAKTGPRSAQQIADYVNENIVDIARKIVSREATAVLDSDLCRRFAVSLVAHADELAALEPYRNRELAIANGKTGDGSNGCKVCGGTIWFGARQRKNGMCGPCNRTADRMVAAGVLAVPSRDVFEEPDEVRFRIGVVAGILAIALRMLRDLETLPRQGIDALDDMVSRALSQLITDDDPLWPCQRAELREVEETAPEDRDLKGNPELTKVLEDFGLKPDPAGTIVSNVEFALRYVANRSGSPEMNALAEKLDSMTSLGSQVDVARELLQHRHDLVSGVLRVKPNTLYRISSMLVTMADKKGV